MNLCTDQLVLALADRGQIAALSRNATDRDLSTEASPARRLRKLSSSAEEIPVIKAAIRQAAVAPGYAERGEAIARMRHDLGAVPKGGRGKVAAYHQHRGFLTGAGTLVDELMTRTGLIDLASTLNRPNLPQVSLEEMVAARPNYLIVESATDRTADQGTEMLHHPALDGTARLSLPQAGTICGGPAYVLAARSLADQAVKHQGRAD